MPKESSSLPKSLTYYQYNESPTSEHYEYFHVKNGRGSSSDKRSKSRGKRKDCCCCRCCC
uniref:CYSTM domain-containing protein n=1 Tax=Mesocestoides corti TaxID=53468 RepID=A0A5K3FP79_MESCO